MAKIETGGDARQGRKGQPVLYVLVAAIVLAVIAGVGMLTWQRENSPATTAGQSQQSARETTTGSTGSNPAAKEPPANPDNPTPAKPKVQ